MKGFFPLYGVLREYPFGAYKRLDRSKPLFVKSWAAIFLVVIFIGLTSSCGKKRPPVPPPKYRPAVVSDLAYRIDRQKLTLSWTIPDSDSSKSAVTDGCSVYRARQSLLESDCTGCPVPFESVADVSVGENNAGPGKQIGLTYTETLLPGFSYTYKVVCFTRGGGPSEDSNVVNFRY